MPQSFLAATDFSRHARFAAERAAMLAAEHSAGLALLHVLAKAPLDALRAEFRIAPEAATKLVADVNHTLARLASLLSKRTGVAPVARVEVGEVLEVLIHECDSADLLVVGSRGAHRLRGMILGSTVERLLGKCPRPVLVVKRAPRAPYSRVLVPVDLSTRSSSALRMALRVAPTSAVTVSHAYNVPFEEKLHVAGVADEDIEGYRVETASNAAAALRKVVEDVAGDTRRIAHVVQQQSPPRSVMETERTLVPDLIVMGKRNRPPLERVLVGSVTRHVLAQSRCDVLVVPA